MAKFRNKIYEIVSQVKDKLSKDAKEQGLIVTEMVTVELQGILQNQAKTQKTKEEVKSVIKYTQEKQKFDEILSAIGEYFELFKTHTDLLEDLWL